MKYKNLKRLSPYIHLTPGIVSTILYYIVSDDIGQFNLELFLFVGAVGFGIYAVMAILPLFKYKISGEFVLDASKEDVLNKKDIIEENDVKIIADYMDAEYSIADNTARIEPKKQGFLAGVFGAKEVLIEDLEDFESADKWITVQKINGDIKNVDFDYISDSEAGVKIKSEGYGFNRTNLLRLEFMNQKQPGSSVKAVEDAGFDVIEKKSEVEFSLTGFEIPDYDIISQGQE